MTSGAHRRWLLEQQPSYFYPYLELSPTNSLNNRLRPLLIVPLWSHHLFYSIMQSFYLILCWSCALFVISACSVPTTPIPPEGPFFDLKTFFEKEVIHLKNSMPQLDKTIIHNATTESQRVEINDWKAELHFFSTLDINKPSWRDQYQVDTLMEQYGYQLIYSALNQELITQELSIHIIDQQVTFINAIQLIDNQIYQSQRFLEYKPRKHYKIKQLQDVALLSPNDYTIQATFHYE